MLDFNSPIPLYYQLKSFIQNQISSGAWKPGEQIPSEAELCALHDALVAALIRWLAFQGKYLSKHISGL